jgi:hypothetical protein
VVVVAIVSMVPVGVEISKKWKKDDSEREAPEMRFLDAG